MKSMESKAKLFSLLSHGTGQVQEGGVIERVAAEAWRSGVLQKFLAGTSGMSFFYPKGAEASGSAAQLQVQPACGDVATSLCFVEEPSPCPVEWGILNRCSSKSVVCPLSARKYSSLGICSQRKVGVTQNDNACCNTQFSGPTPDKLEVHVSETCQKRFIMFDNSGSKKRIIFHPSMVHEISNVLRNNLSCPESNLNHLLELSSRAVYQLKETLAVDNVEGEGRLPSGKGGLHFDFGTSLEKVDGSVDPYVLLGDDGPPQFNAAATEAETSIGSRNRGSLDCSNGSHEDTDLEALLSSDDEISTGHSPVDGTFIDDPISSDNEEWCCGQSNFSKKRKREETDFCDGDDTLSTATSSEVMLKDLNGCRADISHTGTLGLGAGASEEELTALDISFPDEVSSKSSAARHGVHHRRGPKCGQSRKPLLIQPESVKTSRREKIKDTFRLLRGIIPGGESMDAAFVLDETIQYVKSLQVQVKGQIWREGKPTV